MSHYVDPACFCGKGLRPFLGRTVIVTVNGTALPAGLLACFDERTGIVTLVISLTDVRYICCGNIRSIQPATPANGG
ncbi:hypothetical protein AB685_09680 [Bacillus sp. LL01]|uniref:hypothetical protein n=1 Tax=Bacillus sp. LL01 TaxID=1665556 RepID=UPI00064D2E60|nr:hypothetical protein [Bacillus sp. LL01]KMJ58177.1 hypothetical protein AB685_09680 [Bacillus sp. LL01]